MRGLVRLSTETDRVYTINLGKVLLSPNNRRAKRAINMIREFARHHMGISEVKIDMDVSHIIWSKGIRSPPRKIRVRMRKTDEGNILISKYEADPIAPSKEMLPEQRFQLKQMLDICRFCNIFGRSWRSFLHQQVLSSMLESLLYHLVLL